MCLKEEILQSAGDQIKKFGLRRFTIDDIAIDLQISKKTIYKYFSSKNQIISELVDKNLRIERKKTSEVMSSNVGWLEKLKSVIFDYTQDKGRPRLFDELKRFFPEENEKIEEMKKFKSAKISELLQQGIEAGDIRPDIHLGMIMLILEKTINGLLLEDFLDRYDMTFNQALDEVKKIMLSGILKADNNEEVIKGEI